MDRLHPEVLKMIADALHDTLQCPVCLAVLRPPVTLCSSGHGVCPDCKPLIAACPTCREPFIQTTPIILHQLLDALPRSCQFKSLGCTEVYIPGGDHEDLCSYRSVDCKVIQCEWNGQSKKLLSHVTSSHPGLTVTLEEISQEIKWELFDPSQDSFKYIPFVAFDEVFWAYIHMNDQVQKLCISFSHVSNGDSKCEYFAVISLRNGNIGYTYTINIPVDNYRGFIDFYEEHCMTIPGKMVPRFVDNGTLVYTVQIIKEDKL